MGSRICSRIDHALGNADWVCKYGEVSAQYLNANILDHFPILLNIKSEDRVGGRPFKFFNYLVEHLDFLSVIEPVWAVDCHGSGFEKV